MSTTYPPVGACGHSGPKWPSKAAATSGLNPKWESYRCPDGHWHLRRKP